MKNEPQQGRIWPEIPDLYETAGGAEPTPEEGQGATPAEPAQDMRQRPLPGFAPA